MILSMTAYANLEVETSFCALKWEIRGVNHRYLELSLKIPDAIREIEWDLRDIARQHLSRGKIDCVLKLDKIEETMGELIMDLSLVDRLIAATGQITERLPQSMVSSFSPFEILHWPGVIQGININLPELKPKITESFELLLENFIVARAREGRALKSFIQERIERMKKEIAAISRHTSSVLEDYRAKLKGRLQEFNVTVDSDRLEQEIVYIAQKMDISEELDRLNMHLEEVLDTIRQGKVVGRRLDFLMQELNREANTLGSKSQSGIITKKIVELKVLIEEMREQIQNIE